VLNLIAAGSMIETRMAWLSVICSSLPRLPACRPIAAARKHLFILDIAFSHDLCRKMLATVRASVLPSRDANSGSIRRRRIAEASHSRRRARSAIQFP